MITGVLFGQGDGEGHDSEGEACDWSYFDVYIPHLTAFVVA